MKAGQTNLEVGTKVRLYGIKDKEDFYLNGLTGTITHPFAFGCTDKGWVGVYLDKPLAQACGIISGEKVNVKETECEILPEKFKVVLADEDSGAMDLVDFETDAHRYMVAPDEGFYVGEILTEDDITIKMGQYVDEQGFGVGWFAFRKSKD